MPYLEEGLSHIFARLKLNIKNKIKQCQKNNNFQPIHKDLLAMAKSCSSIKEIENLRDDLDTANKKLNVTIATARIRGADDSNRTINALNNYKIFLNGAYKNAIDKREKEIINKKEFNINRNNERKKLVNNISSNIKDYKNNVNSLKNNSNIDIDNKENYDEN